MSSLLHVPNISKIPNSICLEIKRQGGPRGGGGGGGHFSYLGWAAGGMDKADSALLYIGRIKGPR